MSLVASMAMVIFRPLCENKYCYSATENLGAQKWQNYHPGRKLK